MDRRVGLTVLTGALVTFLLISVSTSGDVHVWHEPTSSGSHTVTTTVSRPAVVESATRFSPNRGGRSIVPLWLAIGLWSLFIAGVIVALIAALRVIAIRRPRLRWRRTAQPSGVFDPLPEVAETVSDDEAEQRAALQLGTARNGIVACWMRLERAVDGAGMVRNPADTSAEFTARVLGSLPVDLNAIEQLASLYREARFSRHEMDETHRDAALRALDRLHADLRRATTAVEVGGST